VQAVALRFTVLERLRLVDSGTGTFYDCRNRLLAFVTTVGDIATETFRRLTLSLGAAQPKCYHRHGASAAMHGHSHRHFSIRIARELWDIDVDGTTNLDVVDTVHTVAVDMASTLQVTGSSATLGHRIVFNIM
jgi:hypothetical protein